MESSRCNLVRKTLETLDYSQGFFSPKDDSKAFYLVHVGNSSDGKLFQCHLCDAPELFDAQRLEQHCRDSRHEERLYSLKVDADNVLAISGRPCRFLHLFLFALPDSDESSTSLFIP
jgi:hypothetical protein